MRFLGDYEERWMDVDGIRTRYFDEGKGRTVVLVHGGTCGDASGGGNAEDFDLNFAHFLKKHRVISIDRLGQGYTDNPSREEDWAMAGSVRHFVAFLRKLDAGPYNLVGHSRGGYVILRTALDHPRLVESCVAIDSNTASPGPGRNEIVFATNPYKPGTIEASRWGYEKYSCTTQHVTDAWIAMKQKFAETPKNREAARMMKEVGLYATRFLPDLAVDKDELFSRLETDGIKRPVLMFWGYNDPTAPLDLGMQLYKLIAKRQPRTSMHVVNQAGHHSFRERAAEFNRVVTEFLEGVAHGN